MPLKFIKKTSIMKNKKTGWLGKDVLLAIIFLCTTIIHCHSLLAQQNLTEISANAKEELILANWENTYIQGEIELSEVIRLTISKEHMTLEGEELSLVELPEMLNASHQWKNKKVLAQIEVNTSMGFLDSVFYEFRRFNVRKFVFEGRSLDDNEVSYLKISLPPRKNFEVEIPWENDVSPSDPSYLFVNDLWSKENVTDQNRPLLHYSDTTSNWENFRQDVHPPLQDLIKQVPGLDEKYPRIKLSDDIESEVVKFVDNYAAGGRMDFIIMLVHTDKSTFQDFISACMISRKGFLKVYDLRAQRRYGKPYYKLNDDESLTIRNSSSSAVMFNSAYSDGGRWTYDYKPN